MRIGFFVNSTNKWLGGLNYYINMFKSFESIDSLPFEVVIFSSKPLDKTHFSFLKKKCFIFISDKMFSEKFAITLEKYICSYKIDILSHMNIFSNRFDTKILNWIPDFQHRYLPEFFTQKEILYRNKMFEAVAEYSDKLLLSSEDAKKDFVKWHSTHEHKACILSFVAHIDLEKIFKLKPNYIKNKYKVENYFYVPNQFWQHKNHLIIFKSIKLLKDKGCNPIVLCSGLAEDYRNMQHINHLYSYIDRHALTQNIIFLGVIPLLDVHLLMLNSIAVINVSLFEGWSSTVEECKTLGKQMILSNISVHKEQNPPSSFYVDANNESMLAEIIEILWKMDSQNHISKFSNFEKIEKAMKIRQEKFVADYGKIILSI